MRNRPLSPEFLAELRATERKENEKRLAQFEAQRAKELEESKLRVAGLLAERKIRSSCKTDYKKEVIGTDAIVEKIHGPGQTQFRRGQVIGRYTIVSDGAMLVNTSDAVRGVRGVPTLRVRCVCNYTRYVPASQVRSLMKKGQHEEWGCPSKACLNSWRKKQGR